MTRRAPFYNVERIPLTTAGEKVIEFTGGLFQVIGFEDSNGDATLEGMIELALTVTQNSFVPLRYNAKVLAEFERVKVRWAAQAGIVAVVLVADGPQSLMADTPNPRQLVTTAIGGTIVAAEVTCDNTADLLAAADATRFSLVLRNIGAVDCYIGPAGVDAATGMLLKAGEVFVDDTTTAAYYGITASGTATLRSLVGST